VVRVYIRELDSIVLEALNALKDSLFIKRMSEIEATRRFSDTPTYFPNKSIMFLVKGL